MKKDLGKNKKIKFAFFGTSEFAVIILEELKSKYQFEPAQIITTPDKPKGRKLILTPPPVKDWAIINNIPILQPQKLNEKKFLESLGSNWDLFIVAEYGKIIPKTILEIPKNSSLNVHPSLLPKYRGPSPLQFQIMNDDKNVGTSIIKMDEEVDHGPIVAQEEANLSDLPYPYKKLELELGILGAKLLSGVLRQLSNGEKIKATPQDDSQATFTRLLKKEDGLINLEDDPRENYLKFLAYGEWPGTYFFHQEGKKVRLLIKEAHLQDAQLIIDRVIPEGKKEMNYEDFLKGV